MQPTILIIEDDQVDAEDLLRSAQGMPVEFICSGTLAEAVERLEDSDVGGIIADLGLPDSVGLETIDSLAGYGLPVIVHTGNDSAEILEQAAKKVVMSVVAKDAELSVKRESIACLINYIRATDSKAAQFRRLKEKLDSRIAELKKRHG